METADSYTELEAVDPKNKSFEKEEFEDARLRVHPSSRRKVRLKIHFNFLCGLQIYNNNINFKFYLKKFKKTYL